VRKTGKSNPEIRYDRVLAADYNITGAKELRYNDRSINRLMKLTVRQSRLRGRVAIPGSKSHTIRAVALASLAAGKSEIIAPLDSADTRSAVECYRSLGASIECGKTWRVTGTSGRPRAVKPVIDVGNSGTTLRFAIGSASLLPEGEVEFTGDSQTRNRVVGPLLNSLNDLGANCVSIPGTGKAPVRVKGRLRGGKTSIDAVTSQFLSSLLINTPLAENDSEIIVTHLNEIPYVEITLRYLDEHGIKYQRQGWERFVVRGGQGYRAFRKRIPADFSSATFFFCAGAFLDADLTLEGLDFSDAQGDKAVVDILRCMGANIDVEGPDVRVRPGQLRGMEIDMNATPDALPALAVTACFAQGETRLINVAQARLKETDRIAVMAAELKKMGADVTELPDGLIIRESKLHPAAVSGRDDHRVVMALSLAGLAVPGQTAIDTAQAVSVTFPEFVTLMQSLGAEMTLAKE
jgi:3-phosphoshikimate 1-carboxyvinyltransferase